MKQLDDAYIINQLNKGEKEAFDYFFNVYYASLVYFAEKLIGQQEEAKDIVIDSFSKLWIRRMYFNTTDNVKAFLYISTKNICFDYLRKIRTQTNAQADLMLWYENLNESNMEKMKFQAEVLRRIKQEVENLPDNYQAVFKLAYFEGLSTKAIADTLQTSQANVRQLKARAMKAIKIVLAEEDLLIFGLLLACLNLGN